MHMKESSKQRPETHLWNAILYVLEPEKTEGGLYVGGNAGYKPLDVLNTMLATKEDFGKRYGRQGYHFVVSFARGETDAQTAYDVAKDFCEAYLGEDYDYIFAIHTDKPHMHMHVVFNSVSRTTGYKYHYSKGDWKKYIQPITDKVCREHGLSELVFEERVGVSYASWAYKNEGRMNWTHIIQADVDYAVNCSHTFQEFEENMRQMHYTLRIGRSKKRNANYITYKFCGADGKPHSRRSYHMPPGYELEDIVNRIAGGQIMQSYDEVTAALYQKAAPYLGIDSARVTGTQTFRRLYQAVNYYKLPNPYAVPAARVRKDMLRIERLLDECRYLIDQKIDTQESLESRYQGCIDQIEQLVIERKTCYGILDSVTPEQVELMEQYRELQLKYEEAVENHSDLTEEIQDAMQEIERKLPHDILQAKDRTEWCTQKLKELRREKKILGDILETESNTVKEIQQEIKMKK